MRQLHRDEASADVCHSSLASPPRAASISARQLIDDLTSLDQEVCGNQRVAISPDPVKRWR